MTSLFYRLYPKDATIPDHTVNPAARWAKVVAHGGDTKAAETDEDDQEQMPSESTMSGALAGLAFLQADDAATTEEGNQKKRKAEDALQKEGKTSS
mmetsp:Transcript_122700/g.172809  ORF Transcript_122700/g.172809 Transcript_122700/m.172809 type:complete len:96 (-) Transcript_122700:89-376(-)